MFFLGSNLGGGLGIALFMREREREREEFLRPSTSVHGGHGELRT